MKRDLEKNVREWLSAEDAGAEERAERLLKSALSGVDRRRPSAGFADSVLRSVSAVNMSRAGRQGAHPGAWTWGRWSSAWVRGAVALCLLASGLLLAILPGLLLALFPVTRHFVVSVLSGAWHGTVRMLSLSFASWSIVQDVATAVRLSLGDPTAVLLLTVNVLVAAASILGLKRLLAAPEEMIRC